MSAQVTKLEPNLREYTSFEIADLGARWIELEEAGDFEAAEKVMLEIPLIPGIANNYKQLYGINFLIEKGVNLSKAVKAYGQDWLEK